MNCYWCFNSNKIRSAANYFVSLRKIVKRRKSESCIPYIVSYEWAKFALCINLSSFLYEFQSKVRLNYVRRCLNVIEFRKIFIPIKATTKKTPTTAKIKFGETVRRRKTEQPKKKENANNNSKPIMDIGTMFKRFT